MANPDSFLPRRAFAGIGLGANAHLGASGLTVSAVRPESPAAKSGARPGDILLAIDRQALASAQELEQWLRSLHAGQSFELSVRRGNDTLTLAGAAEALPLERYDQGRVELLAVRVGERHQRAILVTPNRPRLGTICYLPGAHWQSDEHPFDPGHPVRALGSALIEAGYAFLRIERSGLGDSQDPSCRNLDLEVELAGYRAGLEQLAPALGANLYLFGHNLGGMLAPLLANDDRRIRGVAVFGTSARPFHQTLLDLVQTRCAKQRLAESTIVELVARTAEALRSILRDDRSPREVLAEDSKVEENVSPWLDGERMLGRTLAFFRQLEKQDLRAAWRNLRARALVMRGKLDTVTHPDDGLHISELAGAGTHYTGIPETDHLMRRISRQHTPQFSPEVAETVVKWLSSCAAEHEA